jgi:tetratricopeptide (TPR) repeat protein
MNRLLVTTLLVVAAGCATSVQEGERRYREGDRRAALEAWRRVPVDHPQHAAIQERIEVVEAEFERLIVAYKDTGHDREQEGRLSEAVLDYRLALELQPDDAATLSHVQQLARELAARKASLAQEYQRVRTTDDLDAAAAVLGRIRTLDPFDPHYETQQHEIEAELREEWSRRRARIRAEYAGEVQNLVEAGRVAFRDEQLETALDLWRRALLLDPDNERILAYIARVERQLDNLERLRSGPGGAARADR